MDHFSRITIDPLVMGGKPCVNGVSVGALLGLIAADRSVEDVLAAYPGLEREDVVEAMRYFVWCADMSGA